MIVGSERRRVRARVGGVVQGVGFRPYVFRLAEELELGGWVLNDEHGVELEAEGEPQAVERFLARLGPEAPPLATVEFVDAEEAQPRGEREFAILESERHGTAAALVSADTATCADCLAELRNPADRRHRYPFINCTNCGPRFTIVRDVPYDRPQTTMAAFAMCERCRAEYEDPRNRRFHAQPNACPECGPRARLVDAAGADLAGTDDVDAIAAAARLLAEGSIVAVKGLGGYHLACLAADEQAVSALRSRKRREEKPMAVLVGDVAAAHELVDLTEAEEALLRGRERPIVIARRRDDAAIAAPVAPRSADLGVMLPYSPLHDLLARECGAPIVLTSGNLSDEPIAFLDDDARARLAGIADAFLVHDRPIHTRTDDSVVRALGPEIRPQPLLIRRSRGYVPGALALPVGSEAPILGCGAELKSTFCVAKGERAWVGHHIGDLKNFETLTSYREGVEHFERLFAVEPRIIAHDLHPDYLATRYALERGENLERVVVQHHHAHLAACLAEHGRTGAAVGAIFDGAGLGPDATVWGGEILAGDLREFDRCGLLFPVRLPGGDAATREPWRMACSWLAAALECDEPPIPRALEGRVEPGRWRTVSRVVASGVNSPLTTSAGRLFDAVAAICGVRAIVVHEGQAAAELEGLSSVTERGEYPFAILDEPGRASLPILDPRETIRALGADLDAGVALSLVAARFHNSLARATAQACARVAEARGLSTVVLAGGVFQNRLLLERTVEELRAARLEVLIPLRLPPNDGAISYGQVAVAAASRT